MIESKKARIKFTNVAQQKARAKEIEISWDDYVPACPRCGSWAIERSPRRLWPYCPNCGQKVKYPT